jgi:hypothetical protein
MTLIEAPIADLLLALMQSPLTRWGVALAASFWVWLVGDEDAQFRRVYLFAPFCVAGVIEVLDLLVLGASEQKTAQGGWFPVYLMASDALQRLFSPVGLVALVLAPILGFKRGIGFVFGMGILLSAYFADSAGQGANTFFSLPVLRMIAMQLPAILFVLLVFYGLGASARRFWEARHAAR